MSILISLNVYLFLLYNSLYDKENDDDDDEEEEEEKSKREQMKLVLYSFALVLLLAQTFVSHRYDAEKCFELSIELVYQSIYMYHSCHPFI